MFVFYYGCWTFRCSIFFAFGLFSLLFVYLSLSHSSPFNLQSPVYDTIFILTFCVSSIWFVGSFAHRRNLSKTNNIKTCRNFRFKNKLLRQWQPVAMPWKFFSKIYVFKHLDMNLCISSWNFAFFYLCAVVAQKKFFACIGLCSRKTIASFTFRTSHETTHLSSERNDERKLKILFRNCFDKCLSWKEINVLLLQKSIEEEVRKMESVKIVHIDMPDSRVVRRIITEY